MRKIRPLLILAGIALYVTACGVKEEYGLYIISSEGTVSINESRLYPMHSVVKFPQALYVADYLQTKGIDLDSTVVISKDELLQDTWSPMLEEMDDIGEFSFRELLRLSLAESDNNAYIREVWDIMASCNTGADRIPATFVADCKVIHKTGTGFTAENGLPQMNDVGIVIHPDGDVQFVAVFVPHPTSSTELAEIVKTSLD